jgi:phosphatidylglycerophosphate synthase
MAEIRMLGQKGENEPFALGRVYGSRLSRYATWILARTPLGPDAVTGLGVGAGVLAGVLLVLPLGAAHLASAALYQASYILDFSDGEIARLRHRSSQAGSYLDWLGHFYVPCIGAGLLGVQVADVAGRAWLLFGLVSTLGLAAFHASCREHIVIAFLRRHPEDVATVAIQNAMLDQPSPDLPAMAASGDVPAPRRQPRVMGFLGGLLFYPGATHLLSVALVADLAFGALSGAPSVFARQLLLLAWTAGFSFHALLAIRRNYRVLRHLDDLHGHEAPWVRPAPPGADGRE